MAKLTFAAALATGALVSAAPPPNGAPSFDTGAADFSISFSGERAGYLDLSTFVLPGSALSIEAVDGPPGDYSIAAKAGNVTTRGTRSWQWRAPTAAGAYEIRIAGPSTRNDAVTLRAFVMVPAGQVRNGSLNGYAIGRYPARLLNGNPIYQPPAGFVEVTKDNEDTKLSAHFRLKQFLCKEDTTKRYRSTSSSRSACS